MIEERVYGDRFVAVVIAREFLHLHQDGVKKLCREKVPDWVFTVCDQSELEDFRRNVTGFMAKWAGDSTIMKVL